MQTDHGLSLSHLLVVQVPLFNFMQRLPLKPEHLAISSNPEQTLPQSLEWVEF